MERSRDVRFPIIADHEKYSEAHSYLEVTENYSFDSHDDDGDVLYGIDVFYQTRIQRIEIRPTFVRLQERIV